MRRVLRQRHSHQLAGADHLRGVSALTPADSTAFAAPGGAQVAKTSSSPLTASRQAATADEEMPRENGVLCGSALFLRWCGLCTGSGWHSSGRAVAQSSGWFSVSCGSNLLQTRFLWWSPEEQPHRGGNREQHDNDFDSLHRVSDPAIQLEHA